jgi:RNA polymerase sigma factor (TIGR02999 family)
MRQIIVDYARERRALKRGGDSPRTALNDADGAVETHAEQLLAINEALDRLGQDHPRLLKIVECRFFAGYTDEETAEALGISTRTVARDWLRAKAWLREILQSGGSDGAGH